MASGNLGIFKGQWNCRSFADKKALLHQHIRHAAPKHGVMLLQATLIPVHKLPVFKEPACAIEYI
ncbi:hypothetical protein HPB48_007527 [Haemaphysalis longicornis]|uniref:Uncharacterized protein n=1 Tax=Haemaphysalis longicornis TaxID=44386 RepID=A0A9J6GVL0_HAELO|nr:hypothetical protein HPB48_007527 [Haemaphysalis longicornis]